MSISPRSHENCANFIMHKALGDDNSCPSVLSPSLASGLGQHILASPRFECRSSTRRNPLFLQLYASSRHPSHACFGYKLLLLSLSDSLASHPNVRPSFIDWIGLSVRARIGLSVNSAPAEEAREIFGFSIKIHVNANLHKIYSPGSMLGSQAARFFETNFFLPSLSAS